MYEIATKFYGTCVIWHEKHIIIMLVCSWNMIFGRKKSWMYECFEGRFSKKNIFDDTIHYINAKYSEGSLCMIVIFPFYFI
jgi:hypothetical protein